MTIFQLNMTIFRLIMTINIAEKLIEKKCATAHKNCATVIVRPIRQAENRVTVTVRPDATVTVRIFTPYSSKIFVQPQLCVQKGKI